jgi:hypothetical protein
MQSEIHRRSSNLLCLWKKYNLTTTHTKVTKDLDVREMGLSRAKTPSDGEASIASECEGSKKYFSLRSK